MEGTHKFTPEQKDDLHWDELGELPYDTLKIEHIQRRVRQIDIFVKEATRC